MSFVIKKKESFHWPVKIKSPVDGGKYEENEIQVEFKKLKASEFKHLLNSKEEPDKTFCRAVVIGWKGITDHEGNEVPFSKENLEMVMDIIGFSKNLTFSFIDAMDGAVTKN